jgi:hypothetical protein
MWPEATKLYEPVEDLKRTTTFITRAALCNQAINKKKKEPYLPLNKETSGHLKFQKF